jgi:hypothetical protein
MSEDRVDVAEVEARAAAVDALMAQLSSSGVEAEARALASALELSLEQERSRALVEKVAELERQLAAVRAACLGLVEAARKLAAEAAVRGAARRRRGVIRGRVGGG